MVSARSQSRTHRVGTETRSAFGADNESARVSRTVRKPKGETAIKSATREMEQERRREREREKDDRKREVSFVESEPRAD